MQVIEAGDAESVEVVDGVHLTQGAAGESGSVQRFVIEPGAEVPIHDHHHEQIGTITAGTLTFILDGETVPVHEGDTFAIPSGEPHGAINEGDVPAVGAEVFSPPRPNPDWDV